jgi:signal peptidase II
VPGLQAARGKALTEPPSTGPSSAEPASTGPSSAGSSRRSLSIVLGVAALVVGVDQATKWWVIQTMQGREPIEVVGDLLKITYTVNPGAAFSVGGSFTIVLSAIAVVVAVVIVRMASRLGSVAWAVALGGVLGGALGNLTDRLLREPAPFRGHVVDWIALPNWPVFNIADAAIFGSAVLMVWLSIRGVGLDGSRIPRR